MKKPEKSAGLIAMGLSIGVVGVLLMAAGTPAAVAGIGTLLAFFGSAFLIPGIYQMCANLDYLALRSASKDADKSWLTIQREQTFAIS